MRKLKRIKTNHVFFTNFRIVLLKDIATIQKMMENKAKESDFHQFLASLLEVKKALMELVEDLNFFKSRNTLKVRTIRADLLRSKFKSIDLNSLFFIFYNTEYEQWQFVQKKFIPISEKEKRYKVQILHLYDKIIEQIRDSYDYNDKRPIVIYVG